MRPMNDFLSRGKQDRWKKKAGHANEQHRPSWHWAAVAAALVLPFSLGPEVLALGTDMHLHKENWSPPPPSSVRWL